MYEAYFRLQKRPFSATPDTSCLYAPEPIQKLLDELRQAAQSGQGIGVLTASAGTGKTLLCRRLLVDLERQFTPIFLANANVPTRRDLLQAIHFELGRRYSGMEEQEMRLELIASLESLAVSGRSVVLIVDEAHLLNERLLEELRALASLAEEAQPLLRMILVGQMALEMRLIDPSLEALNQRIVFHGYLDPLTRAQSREYVNYRIRWAGGDASQLFDAGALELIAEACNGLPRCLNQLCDHSLLLTFVQEAPRVTRALVEDALADLRQLPLHWNESLGMADELNEEGGMEDEFDEVDEWQELLPAPETIDPMHVAEASAAFEIGGDLETEPEESLAFAPPLAAAEPAVSPWTITPMQPILSSSSTTPDMDHFAGKSSTGPRVFREELVDDRYAALDLRMPRLSRTFEESAISEGWKPAQHVPVPKPPEPPALPVNHRPETGTQSTDEPRHEIAAAPAAWSDSNSMEAVKARETLPIEQTVGLPRELEAEISSNVMDVCRDVQKSLNQWWDPRSPEYVAGASVETNALDPRSVSPYDVVEPDRPDELTSDTVDELLASVRNQAATGRYVPRPSYRHVFSMLRRKVGRSLR
jgi:type II secretory pathway predicted ATPase ExeA